MSADAPSPLKGEVPLSVRDLLGGAIDYAGLFPPANLEMPAAAKNYSTYGAGGDAWALGRFVAPAGRLRELGDALAALPRGCGGGPWKVAALLGDDVRADLESIATARAAAKVGEDAAILVDVVETRVSSVDQVSARIGEIPDDLTAYIEVPLEGDPSAFASAIQQSGARAKLRTGGVIPEKFPDSRRLIEFLDVFVNAELPFKATAGLHHPLAGQYRLTYEPNSRTAFMFGFLNLFLATALLRLQAPVAEVAAALAETEATSLRFGDEAIRWRDFQLDRNDITELRARGFVSFGSCSFHEPLDGMAELGFGQRSGAAPTLQPR